MSLFRNKAYAYFFFFVCLSLVNYILNIFVEDLQVIPKDSLRLSAGDKISSVVVDSLLKASLTLIICAVLYPKIKKLFAAKSPITTLNQVKFYDHDACNELVKNLLDKVGAILEIDFVENKHNIYWKNLMNYGDESSSATDKINAVLHVQRSDSSSSLNDIDPFGSSEVTSRLSSTRVQHSFLSPVFQERKIIFNHSKNHFSASQSQRKYSLNSANNGLDKCIVEFDLTLKDKRIPSVQRDILLNFLCRIYRELREKKLFNTVQNKIFFLLESELNKVALLRKNQATIEVNENKSP